MQMDRIEGLDWEVGCKGVNNDEKLFLDVLRTYCEESQEILERYQDFQGGDIERAIIDMHGMKSASAGIGAMDISAEFKSMELEGKTGNADYLIAHMAECMLHLKELTERIQDYLDRQTEEDTGNTDRPEETLNAAAVSELAAALDDIEFELFEEKIAQLLERNFGEEANEALKKANRTYENFDYDEAKEILEKLVDSLA